MCAVGRVNILYFYFTYFYFYFQSNLILHNNPSTLFLVLPLPTASPQATLSWKIIHVCHIIWGRTKAHIPVFSLVKIFLHGE